MLVNSDIVYLSHGGGPMPLLGEPGHQWLVRALQEVAQRIQKPKAIVVISAHWEANPIAVTSQSQPDLLFDYYGFTQSTYELKYPVEGAPKLAKDVLIALQNAGVKARAETERGLDHGVFVPLMLMYPEADIPVIQIALHPQLDGEYHLQVGHALQALDESELLIVGSGFSFHNMRAFGQSGDTTVQAQNKAFQDWLQQTLMQPMSESDRAQQLIHWESAPHARFCHPREEHLLPLHVCYGLAARASDWDLQGPVLGMQAGIYVWQNRRK